MSLPGKLEQLLQSVDSKELSNSERLWPYPFDAFDVPDFGVLTSYLKDSDSIEDKNLVFQMENSVNCLRALKHLAEEPKFEDQEPSEDSKASFERVLELMKSIPKSENESSAENPPSFSYHGAPRKFLLCKTKGKTPVLVDGQHRYSYNFDPPMVLLVNDGKESEAKEEETLFRAVPASFADEYPVNQMDVDQIKISLNDGQEIVLHLDLNFPVSDEQLDEPIGFVKEGDEEKVLVGVAAALQGIPLMPADGAGIGPSEEMAEVMALERERMFERSQSLSDYADFNLEKYLQEVSVREDTNVIEVGREYFKNWKELFQKVWEPEGMAAAADDDRDNSFKVHLEEVGVHMRVASDPEGKLCCLTLFNEHGEQAENLSGIEIFDETQKKLSSFETGYAEILTKFFNDAKMLTFEINGRSIKVSFPRI
jgi:hypothetical protein